MGSGSSAVSGLLKASDDKALKSALVYIDPKSQAKLIDAFHSIEEELDELIPQEPTKGTFCDWGSHDLPGLVLSPKTKITKPLVILEPWEHVGTRGDSTSVRASTNVAVLARRIGLEAQCIPLWSCADRFGVEALAQSFVGKTLVFEGGEPSVFDPDSFSHECCPRSYLVDLYKRVLIMRHLTGPGTFICLSHQLAIAAILELIKDAMVVLCDSGNVTALSVAKEIHDVGESVRVIKKGEVHCTGYLSANEKGCDIFSTALSDAKEAELSSLCAFNVEPFKARPDLHPIIDAHGKSPAHCEITREIAEDIDGLFIAMFHADEVNVEAALFANWSLTRIASVAEHLPADAQKWLGKLPVCLEIVGSTINKEKGQVTTEVAAMRFDYKMNNFYESYYTCQFHPELDENLIDSRTCAPGFVEDGERLLHSLLRAQGLSK